MTRLGECATCGADVMLVNFDDLNGCRFCIGCSRRGADATLAAEAPSPRRRSRRWSPSRPTSPRASARQTRS